MTGKPDTRHPFASIDLQGLDANFASLLKRAEALGHPDRATWVGGEGLSLLEARLFRLGALVGLGEWELAGIELGRAVGEKLLGRAGLERAMAECVVVMGDPVLHHLGSLLESWRVDAPGGVLEALDATRNRDASRGEEEGAASIAALSEREVFALGLGIACGARCWDT